MSSPRYLYPAFGFLLLIILAVLGWSGYQMSLVKKAAIREEAEQIIQALALKYQYKNFTIANMAALYNKPDAPERIAFAAGITHNKGKVGVFFDDDTLPQNSRRAPEIKMKTVTGETAHNPDAVLTIEQFNDRLTDSLHKNDLPLTYKLHRERAADTLHSGMLSTPPFIINALDPVVYHADYSIGTALVIKRMLPYLAICILVIVIFCGAFGLYVRSHKVQLQMIAFREALFSNMTHELKTPLSSLQLILEQVDKTGPATMTSIRKEHIHFANSELKRMQLLVDKILSFGKMTPEQFELNKSYLSLEDVINEAVDCMPAGCRNIHCNLAGRVAIAGDRVLLINMLTILLDNAFKYGGHDLPVTISLDKPDDGHGIIRISDQGPGIARIYHQKIFTPFFRIPDGSVHDTKGHGLGLSYAAQAAKLHNGHITLESSPGKGTTFIITFST